MMRWAACVMAALAGSAIAPAQAAAADLKVGFNGYHALLSLSLEEQRLVLTRMRAAGAVYVRIPAAWSDIEVREPPAASASNPLWSGYDWSYLDRAIVSIEAAGLRPVLVVNHAPRWAEGARRPAESDFAPPGSWRPSARKLHAFAKALAARYSGTTRLRSGLLLPRVRHYQAWNEPNLLDLSPQFVRRGARLRPVAPRIYRRLLNAFYAGIKAVDRDALVLAAATAPFGDYPPTSSHSRNPPAAFIRQLLCVTRSGHATMPRCSRPARFDVLAFNSFPATALGHARQPDDMYINDVSRLARPLRAAERARTALPRKRHPLWLTEFCWETRDVDMAAGISRTAQARYLTQALYVAWRQRVAAALWWQPRDADSPLAFKPGSGLFTRGATVEADRPKPALASYAFPFLAARDGTHMRLWGMSPRRGTMVEVQRRTGSGWRTLVRLRARGRVFTVDRAQVRRGMLLRAVSHQRTSPLWRVP